MEILPEYELEVLDYDSKGGYIKLPQNVLCDLKDCEFPIFFKITSNSGLYIISGVKEFTAPKNSCMLPNWMLIQFGINILDKVKIELVKYIPKAKLVTLEPQEKELFEIKDYDVFLESQLSNHCIIQKGNIIPLKIFDNNFNIKITEVNLNWDIVDWENLKPEFTENVGEIINCDLNVNIFNKFLKEINNDNLKNKKQMEDSKNIKNEEDSGIKITKLSKEELRKKRLAFFEKNKGKI